MSVCEILTDGLKAFGLSADAAPTLERYGTLLLEGNRVMNLTAVTDPEEVARRHMLDCAGALGAADFHGKTLLDVGTGAGFPGIVLQLCCPTLEVTLLDSLRRRVDWLKAACRELAISPRCVCGRAEELGRDPAFRERYDLVCARAVAELRILCELCLPFVKVGGMLLCWKTDHCQPELEAAEAAVSRLGGRLMPPFSYQVPGTEPVRWVVRAEKVAPTPERYPRRYARIQKDPISRTS